jgi:hypothetical protein
VFSSVLPSLQEAATAVASLRLLGSFCPCSAAASKVLLAASQNLDVSVVRSLLPQLDPMSTSCAGQGRI